MYKKQFSEMEANASIESKKMNQALSLIDAKLISQSHEIARVISNRDCLMGIVDIQSKSMTIAKKVIVSFQETRFENTPVEILSQKHFEGDFETLPDELIGVLYWISDNDGFSFRMRIKHAFAIVSK
jgi:selenocysteine-specific translation elongation factor